MPASLNILSTLAKVHPEYRADRQEKYGDLYEGGERFEANKAKYLRKRQIETRTGMDAIRRARVDSSSYTSHVGGLIEFLVAATYSAQPAVIPANAGNRGQYYTDLNDDADGAGHSLTEITRDGLTESLVQGRSYLALDFPDALDSPDLATQKQAGALDIRLCIINARQAEDWKYDDRGNLLFLRTHVVDLQRSNIYSQPDTEVHTWAFITSEGTQEFTASRPIKEDGSTDPWGKGDEAKAGQFKPNGLKIIPVVRIDAPWIMYRLAPLAIAIFNRESSLDWALDVSAFSQLVIKTKKRLDEIVSGETTALMLEPDAGASANYTSPNPAHFDALDKSVERKIRNLYLALQSVILQMSSKDSGGRQSGVAKELDYTAMGQFLAILALAIREPLRNAINLIKSFRGETDVVETNIVGLDKFDVMGLSQKLALTERLIPLPLPDSVKRYAIADLSAAVTAQAPADIRQRAQDDSRTVVLTPPAIVPNPIPPQLGDDDAPAIANQE